MIPSTSGDLPISGSFYFAPEFSLIFQYLGLIELHDNWYMIINKPQKSCSSAQLYLSILFEKPLGHETDKFRNIYEQLKVDRNRLFSCHLAHIDQIMPRLDKLDFNSSYSNGDLWGLTPSIVFNDYYSTAGDLEQEFRSPNRWQAFTTQLHFKRFGFTVKQVTNNANVREFLWQCHQIAHSNTHFGQIKLR